ncbi:MAG: hypothetical protein ACYTEL_00805 [Planctomycetota bacterium]
MKRFLKINLGEAKEKCFELSEPAGRVFKAPEASLRFIKNRFRLSEKSCGQQLTYGRIKDKAIHFQNPAITMHSNQTEKRFIAQLR